MVINGASKVYDLLSVIEAVQLGFLLVSLWAAGSVPKFEASNEIV